LLEQARDTVVPWILAAAAEPDDASRLALSRALTAPSPPLSRARTTSALCDFILIRLGELDPHDAFVAYDLPL
jgi:hypothetical protein